MVARDLNQLSGLDGLAVAGTDVKRQNAVFRTLVAHTDIIEVSMKRKSENFHFNLSQFPENLIIRPRATQVN